MKQTNLKLRQLIREAIKEQTGRKIYVVMVGRAGERKGPIKAFMDKAAAEAFAAEEKRTYEERFLEKLNVHVQEIPMG